MRFNRDYKRIQEQEGAQKEQKKQKEQKDDKIISKKERDLNLAQVTRKIGLIYQKGKILFFSFFDFFLIFFFDFCLCLLVFFIIFFETINCFLFLIFSKILLSKKQLSFKKKAISIPQFLQTSISFSPFLFSFFCFTPKQDKKNSNK